MTDFEAIRAKVLRDSFAEFGNVDGSPDPEYKLAMDKSKSINEVAVDAAIRVLREYENQQKVSQAPSEGF